MLFGNWKRICIFATEKIIDMIREIINFTKDLIEDSYEITQLKLTPQSGLYVFIDIDENGIWTNTNLSKGKDYDYYDGKNQNIALWSDCIRYQEATNYITMNKVKAFDSKQKIHSCSPFAIAYNLNFSATDEENLGFKKEKKMSEEEKLKIDEQIREKRMDVVKERLNEYKKCAISIYKLNEIQKQDIFSDQSDSTFHYTKQLEAFYEQLNNILSKVADIQEYTQLTDKDYVKVFLRSVPIEEQEKRHNKYIEENLLNGENIAEKGVLGFLTSYNSKKMFMQHKTSSAIKGYSYRFSREDALVLNIFEKMWKRKCFPNPLPIVVDKREINNEIVRIFNSKSEPVPYRELIKQLFEKIKTSHLSDYYLLNYRNTKDGMVLNDFDFVPLFRYKFDSTIELENITEVGYKEGEVFVKNADERIDNIFDLERIVVRTIFNNALVKIKEDSYSANYWEDIKPEYVPGGNLMWQLIMKYRKAFYDYIYKSETNAITAAMFDDMMFHSILSNIRQDEIKTRCEFNNTIKKKINIWFSIYKLFNNNKKDDIMASNVTDLLAKMKAVAKGESNIETPEEFAFGAGQLASYLIDRSAASNKTYAMLEPYLQKSKSGQLQDAIAQSIAVYKHDISVYKGTFELLSAQVLTYDEGANMKPLFKYFLAGCFSPCAVYTKKDESNNNN